MKTATLLLLPAFTFSAVNSLTAQAPATSCAGITYTIPLGGCTGYQTIFGGTFASTTPAMSCAIAPPYEGEGWYYFNIPAGPNQDVTITGVAAWGSSNPAIQVMSGTCISQAELGCANDVNPEGFQTETLTLTNLPPNTYILRIVNVQGLANMAMSDICVNGVASGIDEQDNPFGLSVYPNPFSSELTLSFEKEMQNAAVSVMDILGKEVRRTTFSGTKLVMERADLSSGVYSLRIADENKNTVTKKIVVQ